MTKERKDVEWGPVQFESLQLVSNPDPMYAIKKDWYCPSHGAVGVLFGEFWGCVRHIPVIYCGEVLVDWVLDELMEELEFEEAKEQFAKTVKSCFSVDEKSLLKELNNYSQKVLDAIDKVETELLQTDNPHLTDQELGLYYFKRRLKKELDLDA